VVVVKATFDGMCSRCHEDIVRGQQIIPHRDGYIHRSCASGQDDE
jgi:hypothetical protein